MEALFVLGLAISAFVVFDLLALRYGADSRIDAVEGRGRPRGISI